MQSSPIIIAVLAILVGWAVWNLTKTDGIDLNNFAPEIRVYLERIQKSPIEERDKEVIAAFYDRWARDIRTQDDMTAKDLRTMYVKDGIQRVKSKIWNKYPEIADHIDGAILQSCGTDAMSETFIIGREQRESLARTFEVLAKITRR